MRSIWKGTIAFGLVSIPVKLYSAVQSSSLDLDMLDARDNSRIRFLRVNEHTHKEVPYDKIVRAYKLEDEYVVLDERDFEEASPEKTKQIEIESFVDAEAIDPMYYETSYYAEPDEKNSKAYVLLHEALKRTGKAGLARFVLRNTENLCILHPGEHSIIITRIRFSQELRSEEELKLPTTEQEAQISQKELDMGMELIKHYAAEFDVSKIKDEYSDELMKIIRAKAKGKHPSIKRIKPAKPVSTDLYEQLMQSLQTRKGA